MKEIEFIKEYHLLERIESQSIFFSKHNDQQKKNFALPLQSLCDICQQTDLQNLQNNIIEAYEDIRHCHAA